MLHNAPAPVFVTETTGQPQVIVEPLNSHTLLAHRSGRVSREVVAFVNAALREPVGSKSGWSLMAVVCPGWNVNAVNSETKEFL